MNFKNLSVVKEIRVQGMLAAIDLTKSIDVKNFMEAGLYLVSQTNRIILAPPLIMSEEMLQMAMNKIFQVLKENS